MARTNKFVREGKIGVYFQRNKVEVTRVKEKNNQSKIENRKSKINLNKNGYTLIELAIVILLIGLILSIAFPRLGGILPQRRLEKTVNMLIGTIKQVHNSAAAGKKIYRLHYKLNYHLNLKEDEFWVACLEGNEWLEDTSILSRKRKLPDGITFKDITTQYNGKIIEGETSTLFLPTGLIENTTIHLRDRDENIFTLIIKPLTGKVIVEEGYVEVEY